MAKQLQITVSAQDQATAVMRSVTAQIGRLGTSASRVGKSVSSVVGRVVRSLASVRSVVLGLTAAIGVGLGAGALIGSVRSLTGEMDRLGLSAQRTGASTETLSLFTFLGERIGQDAQDVGDLVGDLVERLAEARRLGTGTGVEAISLLGIDIESANGGLRRTDDLLFEVITKINALEEVAEREFFTKELFGDEAARFSPFFNIGLEQLEVYREQADRLGVIFTPEQIAAAQQMNEGIQLVRAAFRGMTADLIERFGPQISAFLAQTATFVAALPELVGRASGILSAQLSVVLQSGASDLEPDARSAAQRIMLAIGRVVETAMIGIVEVAVSVGADAIRAVPASLTPVVTSVVTDTLLVPVRDTIGTIADLFNRSGLGGTSLFASVAQDLLNGLDAAVGVAVAGGQSINPIDAYFDALSETVSSGYSREAIDNLIADSGTALANLAAVLEDGLDFSASLDRARVQVTEMQELISRLLGGGGGGDDEGQEGPEAWIQGYRDGLAQLQSEADNILGFTRDLTVTTAQSFSQDLAGGIFDAVEGIRSFGDVVRDVFAGVLRSVGQAIVQFAILRTITQALGLFGGGGAADPSTFNTSELLTARLSAGVFNRGGVAGGRGGVAREFSVPLTSIGIPGFNSGLDLVPGLRSNRDSVLAALTPGEGVVNTTGMAINPGVVRAMNRGERVGGGQAVTNNVSVTIEMRGDAGSERDRQRLGQVAADAVLRAMRTNPSYRQSVRGELA